jgi:hypothetical protein
MSKDLEAKGRLVRAADRHMLGKRNTRDRQKDKRAASKEGETEKHAGDTPPIDSLIEQIKRANDANEASDRGKKFREWVMIALVFATAFFAGLTYLVFQDQLKDSHTAYAAVQRAFVFQTRFETPCYDNGCLLTPVWENSGSTPSKALRLVDASARVPVGQDPRSYRFPPLPPGAQPAIKSLIGPHGVALGVSIWITRQQIDEIVGGKSQFWVWGRATYRDVFEKSDDHVTCWAYSVNPQIVRSPKSSGSKELVSRVGGFSLLGIGAHNCSDEDCKGDPCLN